jgi:hypothetical protein
MASANHMLETPPADTHHHKNTAKKAANGCAGSDMVTLITTVPAERDGSTDSRH